LPPNSSGSKELQDRVVRWSFKKLDNTAAQNIFLDCITVVEGEPLDLAMRVWKAWWPQQAHTAFNRLQQLSLVNVHIDKIVVLDVIRSIGRTMLREAASRPGPDAPWYGGSRIWEGPDGKPLGYMQVGFWL